MKTLYRHRTRNSIIALGACIVSLNSAFAAQEMKLAVGNTPMSNIFMKIAAPFEHDTGIKIVYVGSDPKGLTGVEVFKLVDDGTAEAGSAGLHWKKWLELMQENHYEPKSPMKEFKSQTIGLDRVQIITYKGGPATLTDDQAEGLLTGKITNWKDVGGSDLPVKLILSHKQPATNKFVEEAFLKGAHFGTAAKTFPASSELAEMIHAVGTTPGAVGIGPLFSVTEEVNAPKHTVIGRPLLILFKGAPTEKLQKLLDYIHKEGPRLGVAQ